MKKISNFIEQLDLFGHPVALKFNKKGSEHKTVVGGCVSILIRIVLVSYIAILFIRLVNRDDNKNETEIDVDEDVSITFGEANLKIMVNIFDQKTS